MTSTPASTDAATRPATELTLVVNGSEISGWEDIEVTLRAEGFPNSFAIGLSSRAPITSAEVVAKAGDGCTVLLGDDVVITGYIDRDVPGGTAETHALQLVGRGKTQDLVDCSGEWGSGAMTNVTVLDVATKLASKYAITVKLADGASAGDPIDQIAGTYGETGAEQIQRLARNAGLMAYEDAQGVLVLAIAGTKKAASGIVYGRNVQSWSVENSIDGRYSDITCLQQAQDTTIELGDAGEFVFNVPDPTMPRHRLIYLIMEQAADPEDFTRKKAKWEMARRIGRSVAVRATIDSWRDSAGKLWQPNSLIPVDVPGLRLADKTLCLSEVTFRRNSESGTTAELFLMPPAAFTPEPISLVPVNLLGVETVDPNA